MGNYAQKSENFVRKLVVPKQENLLLKKSAPKLIVFLQGGKVDR